MDISTFLTEFGEFKDVDAEIVQGCLDRATRAVNARVWGDLADDGIAWKAAHYLTTTPLGGGTRLQADPSKTSTYQAEFERLEGIVGCGGFLVAGGR